MKRCAQAPAAFPTPYSSSPSPEMISYVHKDSGLLFGIEKQVGMSIPKTTVAGSNHANWNVVRRRSEFLMFPKYEKHD
jgi:hypothetical protein